MADNEEKNYFEFLDIPDGSGDTERWYATDAEAQADIQTLQAVSAITAAQVTAAWDEIFNAQDNNSNS